MPYRPVGQTSCDVFSRFPIDGGRSLHGNELEVSSVLRFYLKEVIILNFAHPVQRLSKSSYQ